MPAEKSLLDQLLDKMRQQRNEQQLKAEQSFFADKPEPDRDQERKQAAIRRTQEARRQAARIEAEREGPGRPLTDQERRARQQFSNVTLAPTARREREVELKFRHEETRAAALQVLLDADEARDEADQRHYARMEKTNAAIRQMISDRMVSDEHTLGLNQQIQQALDSHQASVKRIKLETEAALSKIRRIDDDITIGQMPLMIASHPQQIEDQHVQYPPPGGFNREAYDPYDVGEQFADAAHADPGSSDAVGSEPAKPDDYRAVFEAIARPAQPSPSIDPDGPSYGI